MDFYTEVLQPIKTFIAIKITQIKTFLLVLLLQPYTADLAKHILLCLAPLLSMFETKSRLWKNTLELHNFRLRRVRLFTELKV